MLSFVPRPLYPRGWHSATHWIGGWVPGSGPGRPARAVLPYCLSCSCPLCLEPAETFESLLGPAAVLSLLDNITEQHNYPIRQENTTQTAFSASTEPPTQINDSSATSQPPSVVVDWLTLLLRVREAPGTNPGPETGYSDDSFCGFSQSVQADAGTVPKITP